MALHKSLVYKSSETLNFVDKYKLFTYLKKTIQLSACLDLKYFWGNFDFLCLSHNTV
jgi:hypothetical protein